MAMTALGADPGRPHSARNRTRGVRRSAPGLRRSAATPPAVGRRSTRTRVCSVRSVRSGTEGTPRAGGGRSADAAPCSVISRTGPGYVGDPGGGGCHRPARPYRGTVPYRRPVSVHVCAISAISVGWDRKNRPLWRFRQLNRLYSEVLRQRDRHRSMERLDRPGAGARHRWQAGSAGKGRLHRGTPDAAVYRRQAWSRCRCGR
jgi:hypothetical protein